MISFSQNDEQNIHKFFQKNDEHAWDLTTFPKPQVPKNFPLSSVNMQGKQMRFT